MIKRRENESLIEWCNRCTTERDLGNISYDEWAFLTADYECSSENARKVSYWWKAFIAKYNAEKESGIDETDERIEALKIAKAELEKEKIRFQDQKREYKAFLRADARFEHLRETMVQEIRDMARLKPFVFTEKPRVCDGGVCAALLLSDFHYGMQIRDELNVYNTGIAKERIQQLGEKVVKYCLDNNVETLYIELLGDLIDGIIQNSSRILNEEDAMSQVTHVSELIADMIFNMKRELVDTEIYVKSCVGNHGRAMASIKDSIQIENYERLITWYLKTRAENIEGVYIDDCSSDTIMYTMKNGMNITAVHGNLDKPNSIIADMAKMYKFVSDEYHIAHYHEPLEFDDCDINVTVNGCLGGMDRYAKTIRKCGTACQLLKIYDEDIQTIKIKLW